MPAIGTATAKTMSEYFVRPHTIPFGQPTIQQWQPCQLCPFIPTDCDDHDHNQLRKSGDLAAAGDWNGDGIDTPGVFRPSTGSGS